MREGQPHLVYIKKEAHGSIEIDLSMCLQRLVLPSQQQALRKVQRFHRATQFELLHHRLTGTRAAGLMRVRVRPPGEGLAAILAIMRIVVPPARQMTFERASSGDDLRFGRWLAKKPGHQLIDVGSITVVHESPRRHILLPYNTDI